MWKKRVRSTGWMVRWMAWNGMVVREQFSFNQSINGCGLNLIRRLGSEFIFHWIQKNNIINLGGIHSIELELW